MADNQWEIKVANPSPSERSDYVEVDLESLGVPPSLGENSLRLFKKDNGSEREIPYQIDSILGKNSPKRILTFLSVKTPPRKDDYSEASTTYLLEKGKPDKFSTPMTQSLLNIDYYYDPPAPSKGDLQGDGFNKKWDPTRTVYGVKLRNGSIEVYVSLVPHPRLYTETDYTGSITSVLLRKAPSPINPTNPDNMLSPHIDCVEKRWGQVTKLVFYPPPWSMEWFHEEPLLGKKYRLLYAHNGLMRDCVTLQSEPFSITFSGNPFFDPKSVEVQCNLYRVFSLYPDKPYYLEELFVLSEKGYPISFRPYFLSKVHCHPSVVSEFARLESIPDYFSLWQHFSLVYFGYGFASDSHVRYLEFNENELQWRLQINFHHKTIHYFMCYDDLVDAFGKQDLYHAIGHYGWYEQIFKPLRTIPVEPLQLAKRYTS